MKRINVLRVLSTITGLALIAGLINAASVLPTRAQSAANQEAAPKLSAAWLEKGNPKMDSGLNRLAATANNTIQMMTMAQQAGIKMADNRVRVIVECQPGQKEQGMALAGGMGVVEAAYEDMVQVLIPANALTALAENPAVKYIQLPYQPVPAAIISEGVALIGADDWQTAGYDGTGVKVAILDTGFQGYTSLLGTELPASVTAQSFSGDINGGEQVHGTACAEIVFDVAPGAQLFLVNYSTLVEFGNAVDWLIAQDVDIISSSVGWPAVGPGDGTGPVNDIVAKAKAAGILWVQSAGNNAQKHWSGSWVNTNGNQYNEFSANDESIMMYVQAGQTITVWLRWNDTWGASGNDYDLLLFELAGNSTNLVAYSSNIQNGNDDPIEILQYASTYGGPYFIAIGTASNPEVRTFDLYSSHDLDEYRVESGSIITPADSTSTLAVGAISWVGYPNPAVSIESFSSLGPTTDSRIKPDIVAPDAVTTSTYGHMGFSGTSAAAPYVAASAALAKQSYSDLSATQLQLFIESRGIDMGPSSKDNTFGSGKLRLGSTVTPILSGGTVSPTLGNSLTTYVYSVVYTDSNDQSPSSVTVSIDGGPPQKMTSKSGQDSHYTNGEVYEFNYANLLDGNHNYSFATGDGLATGDIGNHNGPTVASVSTKAFGINSAIADAKLSNDGQYLFLTSKTDKKLYILDLRNGNTRTVNFSYMPESIALSPSSNLIYVAELEREHNSNWYEPQNGIIAEVNVEDAVIIREFEIDEDPYDIVVSSDGDLYVSPGSGQWDQLKSYNIESGLPVGVASDQVFMWSPIGWNAKGNQIYLIWTNQYLSPTRLLKYNVQNGIITFSYSWPLNYHGVYSTGHDIAINPVGTQIFTQSGNIFSSTEVQSTDMIYIGTLETAWDAITFDSTNNPFTIDTTYFHGNNTLIRKWNSYTYNQVWSRSVNGNGRFVLYSGTDLVVVTEDGDFSTKSCVYVIPIGEKPLVRTDEAINTTINSAQLNGILSDFGSSTSANVSFEWGLDAGYGNETTLQEMTSTGSFSADISGLTPNTTYHFRAKAVGAGTSYGEDKSFTTSSTPPTITTVSATPGTNSAQLSGSVGSLGTATSVTTRFVWGTSQSNLSNTIDCQILNHNGSFSGNLTGLSPATTYYYRAEATGHGTGQGTVENFTTQSTPPTVGTDNASSVGHFKARLNGNLSAIGTAAAVGVSFQWGTTHGNYTGETTPSSISNPGNFNYDLTGLSANTTYYYRAKAAGHGTVYGVEKSFTTLAGGEIPAGVTDNATNITYNAARLNGTVMAMGTVSTIQTRFAWGTTSGVYTGTSQPAAVNTAGPVYCDVTGLNASTTYYYRVYVAYSFGAGDDGEVAAEPECAFTTGAAPPPPPGGGLGGGFSGGGGGAPTGPGITNLALYTNSEGLFVLDGKARSEDGCVNIDFAKGVLAQARDKAQLKSVKIISIDSPAVLPSGFRFAGKVYELTPDGATFSPGITLTMTYNPDELPEGIDINSLSIMTYNPANATWEALPSTLDKAKSSMTATIGHFSIYTITGKKATPPPTTPAYIPLPAKFSVAEINIDPTPGTISAAGNNVVVVSTKVSNTGEKAGDYELILKVNGISEESRTVTVAAGETSVVSFTVNRDEPGTYEVEINGQKASFTIKEPAPATTTPGVPLGPPLNPKGTNWWLIGLIAAGIIIISAAGIILWLNRKTRGETS